MWDRQRSKDMSETTETFTIVTTEPSKFAAQFHNRMPLPCAEYEDLKSDRRDRR